jgi:hypothetical protein
MQEKWIYVIEAGNHVSTTYRVVLPREKKSGSKIEPQKLSPKNRPAIINRQNLSVKTRSSKFDQREGQETDLQILPGKANNRSFSNSGHTLHSQGSNIDPQELPPLLITNKSLTLSEQERVFQGSEEQSPEMIATQLVDKFYSLLGQHPSTTKREKSVAECMTLLRDGFALEQIDYAMNWLISRHPTTGSFSRVVHFIDQALKAREEEEKALESQRRAAAKAEQRKKEEQETEEEGRQIEQIRASLPSEILNALQQEAGRILEQEQGPIRFGLDTLIQLKVNELIRRRYLRGDRPSG